MKKDYKQILNHIAKFIELTKDEQEYFCSILKHKKVRRKQFLVEAGEPCNYENYVISGCLKAYYLDNNGFEHISHFAMEDWWISDAYAFLTGEPATLSIDAIEDSELFRIEKTEMEKLYFQIPKFERMFRILFQNSFVVKQRRVLLHLSQSAKERYLSFIEKYPSLEQRVPQNQIASYIGVTPEFLSKMKKEL
ncbi:MAG: Crp/Fnr family transcriptional regulator [Bacteroidetes bacterium]|mgnify:FL=1|nr:Crp/Fnr family transcriptional regulator [Bacteroidota bacterium]